MPKPYPQEFRDDVVKVARNRPEGTTLEQIAKDFGIHPMTLSGWMKKASIDAGERPGATTAESAENRELKRRVRLSSRRTRCCAAQPRISVRRRSQKDDVPARARARR